MSKSNDTPGKSSQDCSICLEPIAVSFFPFLYWYHTLTVQQPCQSLFVAPCSHTWHYKCIRTILNGPMWPHFLCPNCRAVADLEAEVDDPYADGDWEEVDAEEEEEEAAAVEAPVETAADTEPSISEEELNIELSPRTSPEPSLPVEEDSNEVEDSAVPTIRTSEALASLGSQPDLADPANVRSLDSQNDSHSSVAPINIIPGKSAASSRRPSSSAAQTGLTATELKDRASQISRTPSPCNHALGVVNTPGLVEGPMTPRNDAGPFVFDGSAGRAAGNRLHAAVLSLSVTAESPPAAESK
jgi:hypothetical protein